MANDDVIPAAFISHKSHGDRENPPVYAESHDNGRTNRFASLQPSKVDVDWCGVEPAATD